MKKKSKEQPKPKIVAETGVEVDCASIDTGSNPVSHPKTKVRTKILVPDAELIQGLTITESIKEKAKHDRFFLATEILGYKYNAEKRCGIKGDDPIHLKLVETLNRDERFKLIQMFRGSYKTTLMVVETIKAIINDFDSTVTYASATGKLSVNVVKEVRNHLMFNDKLIDMYGSFLPKTGGRKSTKEWNKKSFDILQRKRLNTGIKQPTVSTAGADQEITGQHPDLLILDDIVGPKNVTTADQKQKVIDYAIQCIPILGRSGRLIVVGTPWAYDDAYNYMLSHWMGKTDADGGPLFAHSKMGIVDSDGNPTMPNVYDLAAIQTLREITPTFEFACQYMCDPVAEGNTLFDRRDILRYSRLPVMTTEGLEVYITVDPAISLNPRKCWTGICCGIPLDPYYLYIDEAMRIKVLPQDLIAKLLDLVNQYQERGIRVRKIGIEEQAFQQIYAGSLINELRKKMFENPTMERISVIPLHPNDNKHRRIYGLEPYVRHHQIYLREGLDMEDAIYQLFHYPHLSETNLDILDSMAYFLQLLPPNLLSNPMGIVEAPEDPHGREKDPSKFFDRDLLEETGVVRGESW